MDSESNANVTFYNDEEGWEIQYPMEPLLKNEVFAAMLSGQFKESNTKRICLPGYDKSTVQQFICDLTESRQYDQKFLGKEGSVALFNIQLTRLAHLLNQQDLFQYYSKRAEAFFNGRYQVSNEQTYEFAKLVVDFSLTHFHANVLQCQHQLDLMLELDDHVLFKALCHIVDIKHNEWWLRKAIQYKALKCIKVIVEEVPYNPKYASLVISSDLSLPDDLLKVLFTKYRSADSELNLFDQLRGRNGRTETLGTLLRAMPDDFHIWHKVFEAGYPELVKFAPKQLLIQNNGQNSFGTTAISKGWFKCVELILLAGWDPKPTNALTLATYRLNPKLIQKLLEHGAVPNVDTMNSMTKIYQNGQSKHHAAPALVCLDLIEAATLANAFDSEIYKSYSKKSSVV